MLRRRPSEISPGLMVGGILIGLACFGLTKDGLMGSKVAGGMFAIVGALCLIGALDSLFHQVHFAEGKIMVHRWFRVVRTGSYGIDFEVIGLPRRQFGPSSPASFKRVVASALKILGEEPDKIGQAEERLSLTVVFRSGYKIRLGGFVGWDRASLFKALDSTLEDMEIDSN